MAFLFRPPTTTGVAPLASGRKPEIEPVKSTSWQRWSVLVPHASSPYIGNEERERWCSPLLNTSDSSAQWKTKRTKANTLTESCVTDLHRGGAPEIVHHNRPVQPDLASGDFLWIRGKRGKQLHRPTLPRSPSHASPFQTTPFSLTKSYY